MQCSSMNCCTCFVWLSHSLCGDSISWNFLNNSFGASTSFAAYFRFSSFSAAFSHFLCILRDILPFNLRSSSTRNTSLDSDPKPTDFKLHFLANGNKSSVLDTFKRWSANNLLASSCGWIPTFRIFSSPKNCYQMKQNKRRCTNGLRHIIHDAMPIVIMRLYNAPPESVHNQNQAHYIRQGHCKNKKETYMA